MPSRPPQNTYVSAPNSLPRSIARIVFCSAWRRTFASTLVNAPSRKTGSPNRFVVAIGTFIPVAVERLPELPHDPVALGGRRAARHEIVVVEVHPVRAELGELVHDLHRADGRPRRLTERVASRVSHGPQAEGEVVLGPGRVGVLLRRTGGVMTGYPRAEGERECITLAER